jgi:hypothetical protein
VHCKSHDSSVGIALGYGLDDWVLGFDSRRGLGIIFFTTASRTALGPTQPPIQWVPGALSLGVKRPGREADHSPPSQYAFMAWCLVKHRATLPLLLQCIVAINQHNLFDFKLIFLLLLLLILVSASRFYLSGSPFNGHTGRHQLITVNSNPLIISICQHTYEEKTTNHTSSLPSLKCYFGISEKPGLSFHRVVCNRECTTKQKGENYANRNLERSNLHFK